MCSPVCRVEVISCEILSDQPPPSPFDLPRGDLDLFALLAVALFGDSVASALRVEGKSESGGKVTSYFYDLEKVALGSPRCLISGEAAFEIESGQLPWRCLIRKAALQFGHSAHISRRYSAKLSYNHSFVLQFDTVEEIRRLVRYAKVLTVDLIEAGALRELHDGDRVLKIDF